MTQYAHTISFDDREQIMLEHALKDYIQHCTDKYDADYLGQIECAERVLTRLNEDGSSAGRDSLFDK
jgi:hypothetical protein